MLGLGLAALGRPGYMTLRHRDDVADGSVEGMERTAHAVLDAAYAAGVRHVDAARSYGRAEAFLRRWLDARGHRDVVVSSKWGYRYTAGWRADAEVHEVKDHSLAHLEAQWRESSTVLGAWLRVYQVHSATLEGGVLDDGAVLDRLADLRDAGVEVGLSVTGPRQPDVVRRAVAVRRGGAPLFGWVQATWNLLERSAAPALAEAHAAGVKVLVKEGVANGRLTARGDVEAVKRLAAELGVTPDAVALAAAMAQPWAHVVLSGAATVRQLEENARAVGLKVDPGLLPELVEKPEAYWARRSQLEWT